MAKSKFSTQELIQGYISYYQINRITSNTFSHIKQYAIEFYDIYHTTETYSRTFRNMRSKNLILIKEVIKRKTENGDVYHVWVLA